MVNSSHSPPICFLQNKVLHCLHCLFFRLLIWKHEFFISVWWTLLQKIPSLFCHFSCFPILICKQKSERKQLVLVQIWSKNILHVSSLFGRFPVDIILASFLTCHLQMLVAFWCTHSCHISFCWGNIYGLLLHYSASCKSSCSELDFLHISCTPPVSRLHTKSAQVQMFLCIRCTHILARPCHQH